MNKKILIIFIVGLILLNGCVNILEKDGKIENKEISIEDIYNISNAGVRYELKILEKLETNDLMEVLINLKDNSGISMEGTREERIALSKQKDEWFKPVIDKVLVTLLEDEFVLTGKSFSGFNGKITKKGFDKLISDERVEAIYEDVMVGGK